ncbi:transglutaminase domain-containing protein [Carboxylicivirga sp. A043]|uniref:transglutaminase-like domain-containing protein n=1 Tax=Carboxylicivirga litoralis TaxID=2816963 RepID=UPI0021CAF2BA|nr:transglutaminase-like domain-containing protein [Carboxylicivirga sp. A043]MCU4156164.1 transglutaminase domain-containing protein [Carboxylicivirga sp. A043]
MQNPLSKLLIANLFVFLFVSCQSDKGYKTDWNLPAFLLKQGELSQLEFWADSVKGQSTQFDVQWMKADSFAQIAKRIAIDFSVDKDVVKEQLIERVGDFTEEEWRDWNASGLLEGRMLNGEKKYFKRAVSNLAILTGKGDGLLDEALDAFCLEHSVEVIKETKQVKNSRVAKRSFVIEYSLAVDANAIPAGEVLRCWLPYPKAHHARQGSVKFLGSFPEEYRVSEDSCVHRSIYLEQVAVSNQKTEFKLTFSFDTQAEYVDLSQEHVLPYDQESVVYKEYTKQRLPHIAFTKEIMQLTDSICGEDVEPVELVKKIYYWIDKTIPWAGALEYGIMPNIPEYVLSYKKGDCGMQTLLFMSMARYKGIPVRWQSGWMLHPGEVNLHDWCEVYYQGVGWVPLDMSFSLQKSNDEQLRNFYISGIDAYRLIVNDGIGAEFCPSKQYLRSEPWDFQRGEVEWKGGNLYFDQWDYHMSVSYK